jgi:DNA polymerase-1
LPEINSNDPYIRGEAERQAINHPIQAPSSDVVLMAANEIRKQGHDPEIFRPILFIHDELVYEVKADADLPYYARIIKTALENPPIERDFGIKLSVPLLSDVSIGPNLADMKDFDL